MARPQVADGGDGLQIWRAAQNILNKKSRTADKGWYFSLRVGVWGKIQGCYEMSQKASDFNRFSLDQRRNEHGHENWYVKGFKSVEGRFTHESCERYISI
jgi:hypothetical protein